MVVCCVNKNDDRRKALSSIQPLRQHRRSWFTAFVFHFARFSDASVPPISNPVDECLLRGFQRRTDDLKKNWMRQVRESIDD